MGPAVLVNHAGADFAGAFRMSMGREGAGPGDVAMAGGVGCVVAFTENPFGSGVGLAQREVIGGDVLLAFGKPLLGHRELVHQREAKVVFLRGEIHRQEPAAKLRGGLPADLSTQARFVPGRLHRLEVVEEIEQHRLKKVPILRPAGEQSPEREFISARLVDVNTSHVTLAGSSDIEAETMGGVGSAEECGKGGFDEFADFGFALLGGVRCELGKFLEDLFGFEMDALDGVILPAAFDGAPLDDVIARGAQWIAEVGLLEDFFVAGAGAAIGNELAGGEVGFLDAVDEVEESQLDGVGDGDTVVEVPRRGWVDGRGSVGGVEQGVSEWDGWEGWIRVAGGARRERASWANLLKRVSSPSWADQTARSKPQVTRPWAVSQRRRGLGCLANSSRPTSPAWTAMARGFEEKAMMREPLSNLMRPTLISSVRAVS